MYDFQHADWPAIKAFLAGISSISSVVISLQQLFLMNSIELYAGVLIYSLCAYQLLTYIEQVTRFQISFKNSTSHKQEGCCLAHLSLIAFS
jgi:hypothetical protein